ncbi:MAG TPA: hypothetical protein PKY56_08485 [Candidatus Kapabacteria bacterium]|nr:hypothetical protein [Candidatus Kapabacteria bacterium]HPO63356.1 hypothetical protein [Candidatus Kapabacteria bacterium]
MLARGASKEEVIECIKEEKFEQAKNEKFQCKRTFEFKDISPVNKHFYNYKTVNPIFVNDNSDIIVITVKVFYHNE